MRCACWVQGSFGEGGLDGMGWVGGMGRLEFLCDGCLRGGFASLFGLSLKGGDSKVEAEVGPK